jgi:outer membrane protein OmpA-like peptidoglycan-associated protein
MVTLLLTFFVMLLSLASVQDDELFNKGRGSFVKSIRNLGLGILYSRKPKPDFGSIKVEHFISSPDSQYKGRTIDAKEEEARRIFQEISRSAKTMPSQIVAKTTNFSVTNIRFPPGYATLNEAARRFLTKFSLDLQQYPDSKAVRLYILGLAGDEATEEEQWILSARRAQAVADFLQDTLPSKYQWPIHSWGAGPGGDWVGKNSSISRQSQISIAVLTEND